MKRSELKEIIKDNIVELLREEAYSSWKTEGVLSEEASTLIPYNISTDFTKFQTEIGTATENLKKKYQKLFMAKLVGKKITVRASKGDANQIKTDYIIKPISANIAEINEDWKIYLVGEDKKRYFVDEKFPIKVAASAPDAQGSVPQSAPKPASTPSAAPMTPSPAAKPATGGNIVAQK